MGYAFRSEGFEVHGYPDPFLEGVPYPGASHQGGSVFCMETSLRRLMLPLFNWKVDVVGGDAHGGSLRQLGL